MLVTIDIDDADAGALNRLIAAGECWRFNRFIYATALLGGTLAASCTLIHALFFGGGTEQLIGASYALPASGVGLWILRKRWNGPAWSPLASKLGKAVDDQLLPQH
jgi:hypothetical protein